MPRVTLAFPLILALVALPAAAQNKTLKVPSQYKTIQAAIDAAKDTDTVLVAPGVYKENLDFKGKAITVKTSAGPGVTTVDGQQRGSVVTFKSGEGNASVLEGFTVTNGKSDKGGGIACIGAAPTILGNVVTKNKSPLEGGGIYGGTGAIILSNTIERNKAHSGGGVYGGALVSRNRIALNFANWLGSGGGVAHATMVEFNTIEGNGADFGGGVFLCDTVLSNIIRNNRYAEYGGGVSGGRLVENNLIEGNGAATWGGGVDGADVVRNNTIVGNSAQDRGGGGVYNCDLVEGNVFSGNHADSLGGGAIMCRETSSVLTGNVILDNSSYGGGGILIEGGSPTVSCNVLIGNKATLQGGGIGLRSAGGRIVNNTIVSNSAGAYGGGICAAGVTATVANNIVWANTAPHGGEISVGQDFYNPTPSPVPTALVITYSNVKGGKAGVYVGTGSSLTWGAGMMNLPPLFVDEASRDVHLGYDSPCRNAGSNAVQGLPPTDFEGDPRIAEGKIDIGADEFFPHLYQMGIAKPGGAITVKVIGPPSQIVLWAVSLDPNPLSPPLSLPGIGGAFGLRWPFAIFPIGFTGTNGVISFPVAFPASFPVPSDFPTQALIGSTLTNVDVVRIRE
jgi:hypothetical protein